MAQPLGAAALVGNCLTVSAATHPPCHHPNPYALVEEKIGQGWESTKAK